VLKKLQGISLKRQLIASTLVLAAVSLAIGGYVLNVSERQSDSIDWAGRVFTAHESLHGAQESFTNARRGARSYLLYGDPAALTQYQTELAEFDQAMATTYAILQIDQPSAIPALDALTAAVDAWRVEDADVGIALRDGWTGEPEALQTEALHFVQDPAIKALLADTTAQFEAALSTVRAELLRRVTTVQEDSRQLTSIVIASLALILTVLALNGLYLYRGIARPLGELSRAAMGIAQGDFARRTGVTKQDEIGLAAGSFDLMAEKTEQLVAGLESAQSELREREHRLNTILSNVGDAILIVHTDGTIVQANPAAERLFERESNQLAGTHVKSVIEREAGMNVDGEFTELEAGPKQRVITGIRPDETHFPIDSTASRVRIGDRWHVVLCLRDMSERVEAERALRQSYLTAEGARLLTRSVIDAVNDIMLFISLDQRVELVNRRHHDYFGVRDDEIVGRSLDELGELYEKILEHPAPLFEAMRRPFAAGEPARAIALTQQWPSQRDLNVVVLPVQGPDGDVCGSLCAMRDISVEREADRMKSDFVSLVSHELRTPLTAIHGYVDLLLDGAVGELNKDQSEFLGIISASATRLVTMTNDLLDASRIEAGHVDLRQTDMDVAPQVRTVVSTLQNQASAKRQSLTAAIPDDLPKVYADPNRFIQILTNLVSNASKFTGPDGDIAIRAGVDGDAVRFEVSDSGAGMTLEEQSRLFTRFYRVRNRASERAGGTGLGLAICKALVEAQGGDIGVISAPGAGSTFFFTLPISSKAASQLLATPELELARS
jgi:PAS domain S-box-containing protein